MNAFILNLTDFPFELQPRVSSSDGDLPFLNENYWGFFLVQSLFLALSFNHMSPFGLFHSRKITKYGNFRFWELRPISTTELQTASLNYKRVY